MPAPIARLRGAFAMKPHILPLVAACLLPIGCTSYADPKWRGSLVDFDLSVVPEAFRGHWATSRDACRKRGDYGVRMLVWPNAIGEARVSRVRGYSDDATAVLLDLSAEGEPFRLFLELSANGRKLRARRPYDAEPTVFHRCPQ